MKTVGLLWVCRSLAIGVLLAGLLPGGTALAQGTPSPPPFALVKAPQIYATDLFVTTGENNALTGTFLARNEGTEVIGDLRYDLYVIGPAAPAKPNELVQETAPIYVRSRGTENFALGAGEKKTISFSFTHPPLPEGDYRVRVWIKAANDRPFGWEDAPIRLGGADAFLLAGPTAVLVKARDFFSGVENDRWTALEGPTVDPKTTVTIVSKAEHLGTRELTATPVFRLRRLLAPASSPTTEQSFPAVTFRRGESKELTFPLRAPADPGSYEVLLSFREGERVVSTIPEYRVVVRGTKGSLGYVRVTPFTAMRGERVEVKFDVVSAADGETPTEATTTVTVRERGIVVGETTDLIRIDPAKGDTARATARVHLNRSLCEDPEVVVRLSGPQGGEVWDEIKVPVPGAVRRKCPQDLGEYLTQGSAGPHLVLLAAGGLFVLALAVVLVILRRRRTIPRLPLATLLLVAAAGAAVIALLRGAPARANGIQYNSGFTSNFYLWVNRPIHNSVVSPTFEYLGGLGLYRCLNRAARHYDFATYFRDPGGKVSTHANWPNVAPWHGPVWGHQVTVHQNFPGPPSPNWRPVPVNFRWGGDEWWGFGISGTISRAKPVPNSTVLTSIAWYFAKYGSGWWKDFTWVNFNTACKPTLTSGGQCLNPDATPIVSWTACPNPPDTFGPGTEAKITATSFTGRNGPVLHCPLLTDQQCRANWDGPGRAAPVLAIEQLGVGDRVTLSGITGNVGYAPAARTCSWGSAGWCWRRTYTTPTASCRDGVSPSDNGVPWRVGAGQFATDDGKTVVLPDRTTPGNKGALLLRDFEAGIRVPAGATRLYASFPDDNYLDNSGTCTFTPKVETPMRYHVKFFYPGDPSSSPRATVIVNHPASSVAVPASLYADRDRILEYQVTAEIPGDDQKVSDRVSFAVGRPVRVNPSDITIVEPPSPAPQAVPFAFRVRYRTEDVNRRRVGLGPRAPTARITSPTPEQSRTLEPGATREEFRTATNNPFDGILGASFTSVLTTRHSIPLCGESELTTTHTTSAIVPTPGPIPIPSLPGGEFREGR